MPNRAHSRIPSLDGLRAFSIAAVLLGHLGGTAGTPQLVAVATVNRYYDIAHLGVRVFFVISGFLITGLLLAEEQRTGTVSLSRFYLRRTLRIFPAYFALLGVLALLTLAGVVTLTIRDFGHAVTYTMNYAPNRSWQVGHLWSLAVEEQFYLLWPLTIVLLGTSKSAKVAVAVVLLAPLIRIAEATFAPRLLPLIDNSFETTADALAMGCLLALWQAPLEARTWYRRAVSSPWLAPVLLLAGLVLSIRYRPGILFGETVANLAVALLIARSVAFPNGPWGRLLNARPMVVVGTLSYSLYLWQQLFLNRYAPGLLTSAPLNIALALGCAALSYRFVEKPMLRLRARIERRGMPVPDERLVNTAEPPSAPPGGQPV